ncbi:DUF6311 domain-containing protein [Ruminococcaceae bacterium OttesenSCG-928-D13]|nr:DUF6311 domain-containing protein [Ruminococcaceae bacterium OttesenSCG-928-D13]
MLLAVQLDFVLPQVFVQHYTGWLFFRSAPWTFPIGVAQNMNAPYGAYVGLSDSIPVFAVLFKLLSPVLPATFQYFGLWCFLCSTAMGASAALLLSLFTQKRAQVLLGSSLFVLAPILLDRQLRHCALGAQWLIVLALWLYFKNRRSGRFFSPGFSVISALSIVIHPYFTPMVLALLFALLLENAVAHKKVWQPLAGLGLCLAATLLCGWVFGVFHGGTGGGSTTYGYFSMNLNALFNPAGPGVDSWSLFLPLQNQTLGNYDGFNYLGLGVLLTGCAVLAWAIVWFSDLAPRVKGWLKTRFGLLFVCLCLTVFAVSNVVTAQGATLFTVPLPQFVLNLAGVLRSSGRMFYPVWYLILLTACLFWMRRPPEKLRTLAVGGLVLVQLLDLSPGLLAKAGAFRPYEPVGESGLKSGFWAAAAEEYDHLVSLDEVGLTGGVDLALFAADAGMTTTDPFTARYDTGLQRQQAEQARAALADGSYNADTLYLSCNEATFLSCAGQVDGDVFCARVDDEWFVFAPHTGSFSGYSSAEVVPFDEYPLLIADYTDALWVGGVLSSQPNVVCFYDTPFARKRIDGMSAFVAGKYLYPILEVDYGDPGWILVTLDTDDAAWLRGRPLESQP